MMGSTQRFMGVILAMLVVVTPLRAYAGAMAPMLGESVCQSQHAHGPAMQAMNEMGELDKQPCNMEVECESGCLGCTACSHCTPSVALLSSPLQHLQDPRLPPYNLAATFVSIPLSPRLRPPRNT